MSEFTDEQIERCIGLAIADHDFHTAGGCLKLLAVQNPDRALVAYEMIQSVIELRRGETGGVQ